MFFSGFGGLQKSFAFAGIQGCEEEFEKIDLEAKELLGENLLSPTNSSELNSPIRAPSNQQPPNQKFDIVQSTQSPNSRSNKWETIETTVVYDNGSKETILTSNLASTDVRTNQESCSERCWECIENIILTMFCAKNSLKRAEIYKNMSTVFAKVDHVASRVFPLTFLIINVAYWASYIYIL